MQPLEIVVIVIQDREKRFFVHRRAQSKTTFPGLYGLGAGGRVEPGESAEEASMRELLEETGIRARPQLLFQFLHRHDAGENLIHAFICQTEQSPGDYAIEWDWSGWMASEEIQELALQKKLCPDTEEIWNRLRARI